MTRFYIFNFRIPQDVRRRLRGAQIAGINFQIHTGLHMGTAKQPPGSRPFTKELP